MKTIEEYVNYEVGQSVKVIDTVYETDTGERENANDEVRAEIGLIGVVMVDWDGCLDILCIDGVTHCVPTSSVEAIN